MDGTYLTQLRTAAGAGLATEVLAAPGARVGALIGLGGQAPCQFDAMLEAAPTLREVRVFDIDENRRAAFAAQRDGAGGVRVVAAQSADEAVRGANIVTTVTTSRKPVFSADSIQKGCHVNAIGSYTPEMQELPPELVAGCDPAGAGYGRRGAARIGRHSKTTGSRPAGGQENRHRDGAHPAGRPRPPEG